MGRKELWLEEQRIDRERSRIATLGGIVAAFHQSNLTPRDFFPTLGVITKAPHISQILGYGDEEAFEELKNSITEQLPGFADQIRRDREEMLLKLLPPGYTSPEPLKLATTWFRIRYTCEGAARAGDVINEFWNQEKREAWDSASVNGGVQWSSIAHNIVFEHEIMAAVTKLITDLGVGDPKKVTAEELDDVPCRVVIFSKKPGNPALNMEVGSWRHLVRASLL